MINKIKICEYLFKFQMKEQNWAENENVSPINNESLIIEDMWKNQYNQGLLWSSAMTTLSNRKYMFHIPIPYQLENIVFYSCIQCSLWAVLMITAWLEFHMCSGVLDGISIHVNQFGPTFYLIYSFTSNQISKDWKTFTDFIPTNNDIQSSIQKVCKPLVNVINFTRERRMLWKTNRTVVRASH